MYHSINIGCTNHNLLQFLHILSKKGEFSMSNDFERSVFENHRRHDCSSCSPCHRDCDHKDDKRDDRRDDRRDDGRNDWHNDSKDNHRDDRRDNRCNGCRNDQHDNRRNNWRW